MLAWTSSNGTHFNLPPPFNEASSCKQKDFSALHNLSNPPVPTIIILTKPFGSSNLNLNFKEIKVKLDFLCQIGHQFVTTDHTGFGGLVENWDDRQTSLIAVVCEETVTLISTGARRRYQEGHVKSSLDINTAKEGTLQTIFMSTGAQGFIF